MHIFYCVGGKFGEVAGVFLAEKHSPDAGHGSTGRCAYASGVLWCLARLGLGTGRRLDPVRVSGVVSPVFCAFALLSGFETGVHRTVRCSASGDRALCRSLCV